MGLKRLVFACVLFFSFSFGFATLADAAPMLRLVSSTVGPITVAAGAAGPAQIVEAYNAGDGALSLSVSSSATWLVPTVETSRACHTTQAASTCIPLQFGLNTGSLAAGTYTATVMVKDASPASVDAPQTITVTVQIGSAVPSSLNVYVAPGGVNDTSFSVPSSSFSGSITTADGNNWLSLSLTTTGSFQFSYPYRIRIAPQAGNAAGSTYTGTLVTSGSPFAGDNQTIAATMHVTTEPVAQASPTSITARLAQGAPTYNAYVSLANAGQGTLTATSVSATGQGFTASLSGNLVVVKFDTGSLAPGDYPGSVTAASNAVNGSITVPIDFQVVAKGSPYIPYQGILDDAIFRAGDPVSPGDIVALFGEQLLYDTPPAPPTAPLPTTLDSVQVLVNGEAAPLYYVSYFQINFQIPADIPAGSATVQVKRGDGTASNLASVEVVPRAPRLLTLDGTYGAIVNQDFSLPMPTGTFGAYPTRPAHEGDALTIYAIGLGTTTPSVASGQPAPSNPLANLDTMPTVVFGGGISPATATPFFAGLTPTASGLYQVNVFIPQGVPKGDSVSVSLVFPGSASNPVSIAIR
ncbi:MAG TPA: hypothetical protein VKB88_45260 [Bryobacteraceae bacterium]|nr:hypothetical protein [Bryobacteraceae bacterium]